MFVNKSPSSLEYWLLTRIAIPILVMLLIFLIVNFWSGQNKCNDLCRERGYKQSRYIAPYRFSDGKCICEDPAIGIDANQKLELTVP